MIQIDKPMPKSCSDCLLCKIFKEDILYCKATDEILRGEAFYRKRFDDCPLKEIKEE